MKYGGNTSCVEVEVGHHRFILDAGTGIRELGKLCLRKDVRTIHLLLTHTHWDHINGLPFFRPAYDSHRHLRVMAGHLKYHGGVHGALSLQMNDPMFPVPLEAMKAIVEFVDFEAGDDFQLYPDVMIRTAPLNHPNGATGYRIEHNGRAVCYITDTEHVRDEPDQNILRLIEGADLVIYDSTYTEAEFPRHVGWGHSTWNEGMRLCRAAGAGRLVIFHHEPDHDDAFMDRLQAEATAAWDSIVVAREGMLLALD
jgi:phosphoribosyl 1,2-cyclic phosphodiesterase